MGEITFNVQNVAEKNDIDNPFALSSKTGLNYSIAYRLWKGDITRIDLKTLEKLCDTFNAEPSDFLLRASNKKSSKK